MTQLTRRGFLRVVLGAPLAKVLPWPVPTTPVFAPRYYGDGPWTFVISDNPTYEFGFSRFTEGDDSKTIVGQVQWRGQITRPLTARRMFIE